jgi:hypothetical protein
VAAGLPGLYLCRVESMVEAVLQQDPAQIGFDAACEFPPHGIRVTKANIPVPGLDPDFTGFIYDYAEVSRDFAARPTPDYRRFRAVMPSWDNTARTGRRAYLAVNSNPEAYKAWLEAAVNRTRADAEGDERLVFINAWNEWGEGCHLEPDRRYGMAWLEATRAAIKSIPWKMSFDPASESHVAIYRQIDRLARELGLAGAEPEVVLREASALARRFGDELARRDDVITALNERLARLADASGVRPGLVVNHDDAMAVADHRFPQ